MTDPTLTDHVHDERCFCVFCPEKRLEQKKRDSRAIAEEERRADGGTTRCKTDWEQEELYQQLNSERFQ